LASPVSIGDLGSYLPERRVGSDFFTKDGTPLVQGSLLRPPTTRHHVIDERAGQLVEKAARPMFARLGLDPAASIDLLITNVLLPDTPITGCGAEVAALLGCRPAWIIDLHNGGCGSFPYMLKLAATMMEGNGPRRALLCNVQNTAGQVFAQPQVRLRRHAINAGDGCGVAFLEAGNRAPVLAAVTRHEPDSAADMGLKAEDGRRYWEPGQGEMDISFREDKVREILIRGNRLVPEVVAEVCAAIDARPGDIDVLITNQPNRLFLHNWREALGIEPHRHVDTFEQFGNLYGAGAPITFERAVRDGRVKPGDLVVVAGFAHAGDFAAAAAIRWG
jgi:3-oxoacyl-[acyl-carrier-protein] synthase-3